MEILKVLGITITVCAILLALRAQGRADIAYLTSAAFAAMMLIWIAAQLSPVLQSFDAMLSEASVGEDTIALLLKVTGVALISEFAAQICKDAGEDSLGQKAELAGKVTILLMALPLILSLCRMALSLMP